MKNGRAWRCLSVIVILLMAEAVLVSEASQAVPPTSFAIGSRVVASAEAPVSRPTTTPCIVSLFAHESFVDRGDAASMAAHAHNFRFIPPPGCHGKWRKVVLEADFSIPAGRQFDRTVAVWVGGVNLYFGTTIEPEPDLAQRWHVERDLTDYTTLFRQAAAGQVILNNSISPTTDEPIYASVRLLFYPRETGHSETAAADRVYPLSSDLAGEQTPLNTPNDTLSRQITFPRNVERASLDVIAQSQAHDERWYTCVDKQYLEKTRAYSLEAFEACDGGSFRGVEVLVDGKPAGLAPVYPWIYAGGVAPHLWLPTPSIQTVNFLPFRVDLTPFAGLFDDGQPHTVGVRVLGADHFFNVAANLLIYQDHHSTQLNGELTENTLSGKHPLGPTVRDTLHTDRTGRIVGTIQTDQAQSYVIQGQLHTSRGTVVTTVRYAENFRNHQTFQRPAAKRYDETIDQNMTVLLRVDRDRNGRRQDSFTLEQRDPLYLAVRKSMITTGQDFTARVAMKQGHRVELRRTDAPGAIYHALLEEDLNTRDHADGNTIPPPLDLSSFDHQESGREKVLFTDSLGSCYWTDIYSREERLTEVRQGMICPGHINHLDSHSRPDAPWLKPLHP